MTSTSPFIVFCISFFMLVFGRAIYQYRKFGVLGINYNLQATAFLTSIMVGLGIQAYIFSYEDVRLFQSDIAYTIGMSLFILGSILTWMSQIHLGNSWRVSIPQNDEKPGLVTSKAYEYTRNPIFTSLLFTVMAYVVMLPTWLSIGIAIMTFCGIRVQIIAEETWLLKTYGKEYEDYKKRVPRFFF